MLTRRTFLTLTGTALAGAPVAYALARPPADETQLYGRLSVDVTDRGYGPYKALRDQGLKPLVIMVGFGVMADIITADSVAGYVVRYKRGLDRQFILDGDELVRESVYGPVKILVRPDRP